jgi:hypothetical protein
VVGPVDRDQMLRKSLLAFTIVSNFATFLGLWIAYQSAPASIQAKTGHLLLLVGAIASIVTYIVFAVFVMRPTREDQNLEQKLEVLLAARGIRPKASPQPMALAASVSESAVEEPPAIDGEVYRIALLPRTMSWEILRDFFRLKGREREAVIDCDILLEAYLVNTSKTESRYVRTLRLSAMVNGKSISFDRQSDLRAMDIDDKKYEYGLEAKDLFDEAEPLKQLFSTLPFCLSPSQAVEGWVRFMAKDINPDNIQEKSWKLSVVDSLGVEHPITKTAVGTKKERDIGLRRLPG